jgi:hypothetical protein
MSGDMGGAGGVTSNQTSGVGVTITGGIGGSDAGGGGGTGVICARLVAADTASATAMKVALSILLIPLIE